VSPADFRLSAAVMTHPRRAREAQALADSLPELSARVVVDPQPEGPPSALRASRLAWAAADPGATHHMVLQDDALPVDGFLDRLLAVLDAKPRAAVSLHTEWGSRTAHAIRLAAMLGHSLAPVVDDYIPCVGLVLPTDVALGFDEYAGAKADEGDPDDVALLNYLAGLGTETVIPVGNLVHHQEGESLVGNHVMGPRPPACVCPAPTGPHSLLTGLEIIPYYDFWGQFSDACLPDDSTVDGWVRTSARTVLAGRGVTAEHLATTLRASLAARPESELLVDRLGGIPLQELWIVAFLHGVVAAGLDPDGGASLDLTGPAARAALGTLGPGAVRRVVPERWLPALGELLRPLVLDAVRAGIAATASGARR
jgi:hypothetical protein